MIHHLRYILLIASVATFNSVATPRATVIGSAWKEAVQRVYIKGTDASAVTKPAPYVSPEPPPAPPAPKPTPIPERHNQPQQEMKVIEPSPAEMRQFFLELENILNAANEEEDDDEDSEFDHQFINSFMQQAQR